MKVWQQKFLARNMMSKKNLIFDANNILYRTFFAHSKEKIDVLTGMCHHSALTTIQSFYREYPSDEIIVAFDDKSWRKVYTSNLDECVTDKKYKGQRRQGLTESEKEKLRVFDNHVIEFYKMLRDETSLIVLKERLLEADDLIAGYIQKYPEDEHILISSDKDYIQLLKKNNLSIIDPASKTARSLEDWDDDPNYFMFEKCFRGDTSDNVMSAYPRLRSSKIREAYKDPYVLENIMNNEFTALINLDSGDVVEKKYLTRNVFDENSLLMDLTAQPEYIRELMNSSIENSISNRSKFNYFKFLKFCGKHELKNIMDNIDTFVPLLSKKYST